MCGSSGRDTPAEWEAWRVDGRGAIGEPLVTWEPEWNVLQTEAYQRWKAMETSCIIALVGGNDAENMIAAVCVSPEERYARMPPTNWWRIFAGIFKTFTQVFGLAVKREVGVQRQYELSECWNKRKRKMKYVSVIATASPASSRRLKRRYYSFVARW